MCEILFKTSTVYSQNTSRIVCPPYYLHRDLSIRPFFQLDITEFATDFHLNQIFAVFYVWIWIIWRGLLPIFGFQPHLSSIIRVWQAVEGQELGPFTDIMGDGCNTVGSHILGQPHKPCSGEAVAALIRAKGAFAASTDHGNRIIAPPIFCRQRFVAVALALHLICT